jgi:beta-glucuronidase
MPLYSGVRGTAVYRQQVTLTPNTEARIKFEACGFYCAVFVDGQKIGYHGNGYSPFWMDIPSSDSVDREVIVLVDNRFNSALAPLHMESYDFYQYGGIARSVYVHEVGAMSVENVDVMIHDAQEGVVDLRIRLHGNTPQQVMEATFVIAFDDETESQTYKNTVITNDIAMINGVTVPNHKLWSPQDPQLHTAQITAQSAFNDTIVVRFGIREITACEDTTTHSMAVCINKKPTKLLGFSKHAMHPSFGIALPEQQLMQDVQLLRQLSGNYFRLVHYPHNPRLLDICDEMGILLWQETLGWGLGESILTNSTIRQYLLYDLEEMVNNTFNHPSVIIWAFLNEGASDHTDSCVTYKALSDRYKDLTVNGLVSWASSRKQSDKCLDAADVVSFNSYPGWYSGTIDDIPSTILDEAAFVANLGKPFIKSEIGAGAIPGWQDAFNGFWTINYQAEVLQAVTSTIVPNPNITGVSLWQFYDMRTRPGIGRPRAYNNKGTLDEYRRPKEASFLTVQKAYSSFNHSQTDQTPPIHNAPQQLAESLILFTDTL